MLKKIIRLTTAIQLALLTSLILICLGMTAGQVNYTKGGIWLTGLFVGMWGLEWLMYIIKKGRRNKIC